MRNRKGEGKHLKDPKKGMGRRERQARLIRRFLLVLVLFLAGAAASAYYHFRTFPATVVTDSVIAEDISLDSMTLTWDVPRNGDTYHVFYCEMKGSNKKPAASENAEDTEAEGEKPADEETVASWKEKTSSRNRIKIRGLSEGTTYSFVIRADSRKYEGHYTEIKEFTTQQRQKIKTDGEMIKLTGSDPFVIDARAETDMTFESSDPDVIEIDRDTGKARAVGAGSAVITIRAEETEQFTTDEKTVKITVYDAHPTDIKDSQASIMYHLSSANCRAVVRVRGSGGAVIPQSLAYTGKRYMVVFGMYGPTRIVRYRLDGSERKVIKPRVSLGHPNGATYEPERNYLYCLKGQGSSAFTIYELGERDYLVGNFDRSCSGIAYDKVRQELYTTSRSAILRYDPVNFARAAKTGVVKHRSRIAIQDSECYDGILLHCVSSASNRHGINYIDVYDMPHRKYIGSISCSLSEVESCIVNDDGFLEVLSNGKGDANYIWQTDFNVKLLAKEFH